MCGCEELFFNFKALGVNVLLQFKVFHGSHRSFVRGDSWESCLFIASSFSPCTPSFSSTSKAGFVLRCLVVMVHLWGADPRDGLRGHLTVRTPIKAKYCRRVCDLEQPSLSQHSRFLTVPLIATMLDFPFDVQTHLRTIFCRWKHHYPL